MKTSCYERHLTRFSLPMVAALLVVALSFGACSASGDDQPAAAAAKPKASPQQPALPAMSSVSGLEKLIAELKEKAEKRHEAETRRKVQAARHRTNQSHVQHAPSGPRISRSVPTVQGRKPPTHQEQEEAGTDYLEALLQYTQQRAFPFDRIDWSAYPRAVTRRDQMPAANLTGGHTRIGIQDLGGTWSFMGPTNLPPPYRVYYGTGTTSGRVNTLAYHPTVPGTYFLGSAGGGLWKSTDSGQHWAPITDGWPSLQVSTIAFDPTNSQIMYVGTGDFDGFGGYGFGIMKSIDGGTTWTNLGQAEFGDFAVNQIAIDPENPSILTVASGRGRNWWNYIWRSTDGGSSWNAVLTAWGSWSDIKITAKDSAGNRNYYVTGADGATAHFWRSSDRGATWTQLFPPITNYQSMAEIATSPTDPNTVYLILPADNRVLKSTSAGDDNSWQDITGNLPAGYNWSQGWYDLQLTTASRLVGGVPTDVLYTGLITVSQSPSGDGVWQDIGKTFTGGALTHNDQHAMALDPANSNNALIGNDGGVYGFSWDPAANTWNFNDQLSKTLGITQFYHFDADPTSPNRMLGGTQDNATPVCTGDPLNWQNKGGGDGGGVAINPKNPLVQYTCAQSFGPIYRTADAWVTSKTDNTISSSGDRLPFIGQMALDPSNPDRLYVGTDYLWRYTASTNSWEPRLGGIELSPGGTVQAMAVAPTDSKRIYAGTNDGYCWMSTDDGATWSQIQAGTVSLPNRAITSITVDPLNASKITVGLSGTGSAHVWRCNNTVSGTRTWTNISGTTGPLPDIPVNAIALDLDDPGNIVYVATDIGAFATSNGGTVWKNATQPLGLPNVQVNDMKAIEGTRSLYAATYGRGIWRIPLPAKGVFSALSLSPNAVKGAATVTGTVTLNASAPAGGKVINLSSSNPSVASVPATVTVPEGSTIGTFSVTTTDVTADTDVLITATSGAWYKRATLSISTVKLTSLTLSPTSVVAGGTSTGTVTIDVPAPGAGVSVGISSGQSVATVPASVTIPGGSTSATFTVNTSSTSVDVVAAITGTLYGVSKSANLTVKTNSPALYSLKASPASVTGGASSTGTVTMTLPVSADTVVNLSSSNSVVSMPASVTVLSGNSTATFPITTVPVKTQVSSTLMATYKSVSKSITFTVKAPTIQSVKLSPASVVGGVGSTGTVTLTGPIAVGAGPFSVSIKSSNTAAATVPSSVSIPEGGTTATFAIATKPVAVNTIVTISAIKGTVTKTANLTVKAPVVSSIKLNPTALKGGISSAATVTLTGIAPTGGVVVNLASSNTSAAQVPASVTVLAGTKTIGFTVTTSPVIAVTKPIISATAGVTKSATLTVNP